MKEFAKKHGVLFISLLVIISLLLLYTAYDKQSKTIVPQKLVSVLTFENPDTSLRELNKVAALAGIGLLAITFLLGPLSRMFPLQFGKYLIYRKNLGIAAFVIVLLHSAYSAIVIYKMDIIGNLFGNRWLGLGTGLAGLLIFLAMTLTSTKKAVEKMGYKNWKLLQTTGYVALLLSVIHFVVVESRSGYFDVRPYALLFLLLPIVAILVRAGSIFTKVPQAEKYEHHTGQEPLPRK